MNIDHIKRWFDAALGGIGLLALIVDREGRIIHANELAAGMTGWSPDSPPDESRLEHFVPERAERERVRRNLDLIPRDADAVPADLRCRVISKTGGSRVVSWSFGPLGDMNGVIMIGKDITEIARAEEEKNRQRDFLADTLEALTHPLYVIDAAEYTIVMANSAAGFGALTGREKCYELTHHRSAPCDDPDNECPLEIVKRTKQPASVKHVHYDKEGRARHVEVRGYPVLDESGAVRRMIEYTMDVTGREMADRELRDSRRRYIDIIENIAEAIIEINGEGAITIWNKAAERMFGYTAAEAIGENITMVIPPEFREESEILLKKAEENARGKRRASPVEAMGLRKNGARFPVELLVSITSGGVGERRFTGIFRDLTEQKRSREALIRAESLGAVGRLLSGIAHELNNPLTAIMGYSEAALDHGSLPEPLRRDIEMILGESRRSSGIVRGLLNFVRRRPASKTRADVGGLVMKVLSLKAYHLKLDNIEIQADLDGGLPCVMADEGQIQQVFLNLVQNAHDAIQETGGPGWIAIKGRARDGRLLLEFENSGPPIRAGEIEKIFEFFYTTKEAGRGSGLGLAISHGIVEEHGGRLSARNTERGVLFTVELPVCEAGECGPEPPAEDELPDGAGKTALIVDDEPSVGKALARCLVKAGFEVVHADGAEQALEKLGNGGADIVIIDLLMPGMNGFDLYGVIRERWPEMAERTIFTSGMVEERAARFAEKEGRIILEKPFGKDRLYEAVISTFKRASGMEAAGGNEKSQAASRSNPGRHPGRP